MEGKEAQGKCPRSLSELQTWSEGLKAGVFFLAWATKSWGKTKERKR